MSSAGNPPGAPEHRDPTFRVYNAAQAARYAKYRAGFVAPNVVKFVLAYHGDRPDGSSVGLKSFLDVGTGPGAVARAMAPYFERVVGVDAGEAMLGAARSLGGKTKAGEEIGYILCPAEEIDKIEDAIPHGSVDLVAAQAAAHWFDMAAFYAAAAKVLKPGGTLALWTHSSFYAHPTEANAAEMNEVMRHMELDVLEPYRKAGNQHAHELYANLPTPFSLSSSPDNPSDLVSLYDKSSIVHQAWNKGGALEPGQDDFFSGTFDAAISDLEAALGTSSMVTRWREAHPQEAGGDGDPVRVVAAEIRRLRGVTEGTDEDKALRIKMGVSTGMLLMRRAAA